MAGGVALGGVGAVVGWVRIFGGVGAGLEGGLGGGAVEWGQVEGEGVDGLRGEGRGGGEEQGAGGEGDSRVGQVESPVRD